MARGNQHGYELEQTSEGGFFSGTFCGFNNGDYQYVHSLTGEFDSWSGWGEVGNPPLGSSCDFNPNDSYQNYGFTINIYQRLWYLFCQFSKS